MSIFKIQLNSTKLIQKKPDIQAVNKQSTRLLEQTQKALNSSVSELEKFTNQDIPQMQEKQKEIIASLEKLAQSARIEQKKN